MSSDSLSKIALGVVTVLGIVLAIVFTHMTDQERSLRGRIEETETRIFQDVRNLQSQVNVLQFNALATKQTVDDLNVQVGALSGPFESKIQKRISDRVQEIVRQVCGELERTTESVNSELQGLAPELNLNRDGINITDYNNALTKHNQLLTQRATLRTAREQWQRFESQFLSQSYWISEEEFLLSQLRQRLERLKSEKPSIYMLLLALGISLVVSVVAEMKWRSGFERFNVAVSIGLVYFVLATLVGVINVLRRF